MPDVGAQSMMGGYSVEKFHREGGGGVCFHSLVKEPLIDAYWSPEGWYNTVFVVMQLVSCSALLRAVVINDRKARAGDHAKSPGAAHLPQPSCAPQLPDNFCLQRAAYDPVGAHKL